MKKKKYFETSNWKLNMQTFTSLITDRKKAHQLKSHEFPFSVAEQLNEHFCVKLLLMLLLLLL
jgi:hypothetical protein